MGWSWIDRKKGEGGEWTGFLEQGVTFEGKLEAIGTFRIDSAAKGTLVSRDTLVLGEGAFVEGEILGNIVLISGRFAGKIKAQNRVEIQARAVVTGEIETPCLMIEPGGIFDGQCHMVVPPAETAKAITIPIRSIAIANVPPN
jgi:cytoskeletal protein CcmA (bactofilin family)